MFEVHTILNINVSICQVELIQNSGNTSIKLKSNSIPQRTKVKKKLLKSHRSQS